VNWLQDNDFQEIDPYIICSRTKGL
jgi:hypothetical protein